MGITAAAERVQLRVQSIRRLPTPERVRRAASDAQHAIDPH
jgi:hypothetical protein